MTRVSLRIGMLPVLQAVCCRGCASWRAFRALQPAAITTLTLAITNVKSS
jgi:hypothetical protein